MTPRRQQRRICVAPVDTSGAVPPHCRYRFGGNRQLPHSLIAPFSKGAAARGFTLNFFARRYGRGARNYYSLPLRVKRTASVFSRIRGSILLRKISTTAPMGAYLTIPFALVDVKEKKKASPLVFNPDTALFHRSSNPSSYPFSYPREYTGPIVGLDHLSIHKLYSKTTMFRNPNEKTGTNGCERGVVLWPQKRFAMA